MMKKKESLKLLYKNGYTNIYKDIYFLLVFSIVKTIVVDSNENLIQFSYNDFWKDKIKNYFKIFTTNYYIENPINKELTKEKSIFIDFLHGKITFDEKIDDFFSYLKNWKNLPLTLSKYGKSQEFNNYEYLKNYRRFTFYNKWKYKKIFLYRFK